MKPIIVQGAQFGSESKGACALFLCEKEGVKWTCRTGSINAGHTIVKDGKKVAFQQLPVGAVLDGVKVVIGPGAYVHQGTLLKEAEIAGCWDRLFIDANCGVHLDSFTDEATVEKRNLKIGATGKGCAEAVIHKIKDRGVGVPLLLRERWNDEQLPKLPLADTAEVLNDAYDRGEPILIEGTQGTLLDLHTGPYPYTTCRQCTAAAWVTEAGLSPALDYEVVLVARTYPIRVAGNSGPMKNEIDWPTLTRRMNERLKINGLRPAVHEEALREFEGKLAAVRASYDRIGVLNNEASLKANTEALLSMSTEGLDEVLRLFETTTVTKRLRRVAELDEGQLKVTIRKERPRYLILTFLNYVYPELAGSSVLHDEATDYLEGLQGRLGCWVRYASVGPRSEDILETGLDDPRAG